MRLILYSFQVSNWDTLRDFMLIYARIVKNRIRASCWPATHARFHFVLSLVMNWGNYLNCGAVTRLCLFCDLNCGNQTKTICRKETRKKYTKRFSTCDSWTVELCMLLFSSSHLAWAYITFVIGRALGQLYLFRFHTALQRPGISAEWVNKMPIWHWLLIFFFFHQVLHKYFDRVATSFSPSLKTSS